MPNRCRIPFQRVEQFAATLLHAAGATPEYAAILAESLVYADLRGVDSHGVIRLVSYLARVKAGVMRLDVQPRIVRQTSSAALLDAQNGPGQIAGCMAMDMATDMAATHGVGVVGVCNSNHFGVAAFYAARAIRRSMIGVVFTNAAPAMPPYNGKTPLLGTNPLAIGAPVRSGAPLILDMATSHVARGRIRKAALAGEPIPLGWGLDEDGRPTTDAQAALRGSVSPMAGPKGAGLSLMIDVLCGALTAGVVTGTARAVPDLSGPAMNGHLFMALNPDAFGGLEAMYDALDGVRRLYAAMPAQDGGTVHLPGGPEAALEAENRASGLPVSTAVRESLAALGKEWNVSWPAA